MAEKETDTLSNALRSLERTLVKERAEIGLALVADRLLFQREQALDDGDSPPHPLELLRMLVDSGFHHATGSTALPYLERCHGDGTLPDRQRLLRLLLGWPRADRL